MQFTLVELWGHMGFFARGIVVVLFIMSLMSLVVAAERLLAWRASALVAVTELPTTAVA